MTMRMRFYATRTPDGLIHVQNILGGHLGQHHVHDEADYERWKAGDPKKLIPPVGSTDLVEGIGVCGCGFEAGEMRATS